MKVYKLSGNIDALKKKSAGTVQYSDLIEDEEDVDEIIKQHLMEEEQKGTKGKKKRVSKKKEPEVDEPETEEDLFTYKRRDTGVDE